MCTDNRPGRPAPRLHTVTPVLHCAMRPFLLGAAAAAVLSPAIGAWTWLAIAVLAAVAIAGWLSRDGTARLAAAVMLGFCRVAPVLWPEDFADGTALAELHADEARARAVLGGRDR